MLQPDGEPAADQIEEQQAAATDGERRQMRPGQRREQRGKQLHGVLAADRDAEDVLELAECDENARRADEAGNHRMAEEVRQEAQAQHRHEQQHRAGKQRQQHGRCGVFRAARGEQRPESGGGHQRNHRYRADRQGAAGAEQRIGDQWQHAGVQAGHRRQAGEHGVGQALRDQH